MTELALSSRESGLEPAGASRTERALQLWSGLLIALFGLLHLLNAAFAIWPGGYDGVQRALRVVYQFPPVEILLLVAIIVHGATGIRAMRRPRAPASRLPLRARLHRYSGWYLLAVMGGHVAAVRGLAVLHGTPPGFAGLSFSLAWMPWLFAPYYAMLGWSGLYHALNGMGIALAAMKKPALARLMRGTVLTAGMLTCGAAILLGLAGMAGYFYEVGDPFDNPYAAVYRRYLGSLVPEPGDSN